MMDERECLAAIAAGSDASTLLNEADPKLAQKFMRVDRSIRSFLVEVQKHFPDAQYYTASGGFNLLLGSPHDDSRNQRSQSQLVAVSGFAKIGDGDF